MKPASEQTYEQLFLNHPVPILILDAHTYQILETNIAAEKLYDYCQKDFRKKFLSDLFSEEDFGKFLKKSEGDQNALIFKSSFKNIKKNEEFFFAEINISHVKYGDLNAKMAAIIDITTHTNAQLDFKKMNEKYQFLTEETFDAIWDWDLATGHLKWNEGAKKMFDIEDSTVLEQPGWWSHHLHPDDKKRVEQKLKTHLMDHTANWQDEYRFKTKKGSYKYISDRGYLVFDDNKHPIRMLGAMQDITQVREHEATLQRLNNSLEKRAKELAESNEELERFAYVASHDLQEPLRMVTSFLQLLEKKYKNKLDQKAQEYINYAVDGAERMKKLILDLLEYSRVNTATIEKENVNLNEILQDIQFIYKNVLAADNGKIYYDKLPVVKGNKTQILQLFQNLVGNAIKYRSKEPPVIKISCEEELTFYKFAIADNGIGIDSRFYKKIFIIFQRLHTREQYSGTGIGLAICKKIIDKHGGKLWLSSMPGQGSTFYLTLPKS